ncbi:MAG: histidine phosphatase family protein [Pseudomonadota bacterium]
MGAETRGAPRVTILDFLRHGEPVGGKRYRGQTDDPLSDKGWTQMLAATAGERPWQAIVTSPLARCRAFAERLAAEARLPLGVEPGLMEVGFGAWEGLTGAEINRHGPDTVFDFKRDPLAGRPLGAESLETFSLRVASAYEGILAAHAGKQVLVVAHAGVIRMVVCHVLGLAPERAYRINVGSAAMARVKVEQRGEKRLDTLLWINQGA